LQCVLGFNSNDRFGEIMRVGINLESDQWGGVDIHLNNMIRYWSNMDELILFSNNDNPGLQRIFELTSNHPNIRLVTYRSLPRLGTLCRVVAELFFLPVFFWFSDLRFRYLIRKFGPFDGFISDNGGYPGSWVTLAASRAAYKSKIEKRLLLIHHDARERSIFRQTYEHLVDHRIPKWCPRIVAVSAATRNSLITMRDIDLNRCSITVVRNSVDENYETNILPEVRTRALCGISDQDILIGTLGRLDAYKGHDELVVALSQLPRKFKDRTHLCIVGGFDTKRIEKIVEVAIKFGVSDKIHFLGYVDSHPRKIIETFDILVSATQSFEAFGLTIAEAISVGVPVLATDVGGVSEFFGESDGVLVPPGDIDSITSGLLVLIDKVEKKIKRDRNQFIFDRRFDPLEMSKKICRELIR